jgi:hypothetical protein
LEVRFFRGEAFARYIFCVRYTFCAGLAYDGANFILTDSFSQKILPITLPEKCTGGWGHRHLSESVFKVRENSPPPKKIAAKIFGEIKKKFFRNAYIAHKK